MPFNIPANTQTAIWEATKEIGRWVLFFAISWVITATLDQITQVPEFATVKVWVFTYMIPVRLLIQFLLTLAQRAVDKFIHEWNGTRLNGLAPF